MLVLLFYYFKKKNIPKVNKPILIFLLPLVVLIVAEKTITQSPSAYQFNESFLSWTVLALSIAFTSPLPCHQVVGFLAMSFFLYIGRMWLHYEKIRDDLYVHSISSLIVISIMVRSKESFDRQLFSQMMITKNQAAHWLSVLE
jgi:hypothetical protein